MQTKLLIFSKQYFLLSTKDLEAKYILVSFEVLSNMFYLCRIFSDSKQLLFEEELRWTQLKKGQANQIAPSLFGQ